MAKEADYGLMIWDGKSRGTLNNIVNLLKGDKKILVYFSPTKEFYKIITPDDLAKLLARCEKKSLEIFEESFKISQFLKKEQQQELDFA
jgi:hypothetical protein